MSIDKSNNKVLVVDDMRSIYLTVQVILTRHGYETYFEKDSQNVLKVVKELKPSIILLDFEMPFLSGPEVCQLLKADPETKDIPVIFVTSHTDDIKIEQAFDSGADDYVVKPVREKELLPRMHRILLNIQLQKKIQSQYAEQVTLTRVISHDLNNYLSIVRISLDQINDYTENIETLSQETYLEKIKKSLSRSQTSVDRVLALVTNVKEIQYLSDETYSLPISPIKLHSVFSEAQDIFSERVTNKGLKFDMQCAEDIEVLADRNSLIMSVINNLISNAIKFTKPGGTISIRANALVESVRVVISDNGVGMDSYILQNIFSTSVKTSRKGTNNEPGTGFGMPIVKRYMELYGGTINIESKSAEFTQGSGTRVILSFKKP